MPRKEIGQRTRSAALSVVPILILTFAVIGSMSFLARSAFDSNERDAIALEQRRIVLAVEGRARDLAEALEIELQLRMKLSVATGLDLQVLADGIAAEHNADFVAVHEKGGKLEVAKAANSDLLHERLAAADDLLGARRAQLTDFARRKLGQSRALFLPDQIVLLVALDLGRSYELTVAKPLRESDLHEIGTDLMLNSLRFRDRDNPLKGSAGEAGFSAVAWNRVSDGSITLESVASIGFLGISLIGIYGLLVYLHIRRITRELETNEAEAQHRAGHDPLSSLPNRLLFSKRLDQELKRIARNGGGLSVMYLDLDKFKEVNDQHGHAAGDKLIVQVARRLSDLLRGADTAARFGGDEFAIIQVGVDSIAETEALARRILEEIGRPFQIDGVSVRVGVTIGISVAPANASDSASLMRYADVALYRAKNEGRNRFSFFEVEMNEQLRTRKLIEDDLRAAIERDELVLYYQPVVTPDGGRIVSLEALVRWKHPVRGLIPPMEFIPVAEERGLICGLGEWVLRKACIEARRWPGMTVSVNVSPIQFRRKDFVRTVAAILKETAFDPGLLELELTEGVVVEDADAAEEAIMELRAMGVRLALDDFGVGYSSLIYLRRFAFDRIKIDKSFLESMEATGESAVLVHSIVHLGRALGLQVTAEGVETDEQRRYLQAVGCHHLQGYFFARPMPANEMDVVVRDINGSRAAA